MANRAYLFCSDCDPGDPLTWSELDRNGQRYYDSYHNIPLAWFFFFKPDDVKLIDVCSSIIPFVDKTLWQDQWQEPKFMASKRQALETFKQREPLLSQIVGSGLYSDAFARFLPFLESLPGACLCMDPGEVAQGDEEDYLPLRRAVELVDNGEMPLQILREALGRFSEVAYKDGDDFVLNLIGTTYW